MTRIRMKLQEIEHNFHYFKREKYFKVFFVLFLSSWKMALLECSKWKIKEKYKL